MRADGVVTLDVAREALVVYEVDDRGLDRLDRGVLQALVGHFGGGPVGLSTLAVAVGEERETVEEVAEPFLVRAGLLARTPRGRVATPAAWAHLGLTPPAGVVAGRGGPAGTPDLFDLDPDARHRRHRLTGRTTEGRASTPARPADHDRADVQGPARVDR